MTLLSKQFSYFLCAAVNATLLFILVLPRPILAGSPLEGSKPAHWRVTWTTDPSQTAVISWSTAKAAKKSSLRYRVKNTDNTVGVVAPESGRFTGSQTELYYYHARLTDLNPSTAYEIQISSDDETSPKLYFVTAPATDRPFSILHGGDSRSDHDERRRVNQKMASMVFESYENDNPSDDIVALAHGGDYVATGKNLEQWSKWLSDHELTTCDDGRMLPVIPARGNHDTGVLFNQVFGFADDDLNYYAMNIGPVVRFVTLNSETSTAGDQATWLGRELRSSRLKNRWLLAQYHRPAYPAVKTPSTALQSWVPLFDKHNMDLVCEADGHNIKRTVPIRGNVEDKTGVIYIGEGGLGVGQRTPKVDRWYLQAPGMSDSGAHVFVLAFGKGQLTGRCVRVDGTIVDQFTLKPRNIRSVKAFVVAGAPQYLADESPGSDRLDPSSEKANSRFIKILKGIPKKAIPKPMGGGTVPKSLNGILITGNLIDGTEQQEGNESASKRLAWDRYKADYGLTGKDGGVPFPVYEQLGNYVVREDATFIAKDIIARNKKRLGIKSISENGKHYSWKCGALHMVSLGIVIGNDPLRKRLGDATMESLDFLAESLGRHVGDSGRPVVLTFDLHPNGPASDWTPQDRQLFWQTVKKYNIVAVFNGPTDSSPPSRSKWNENEFGSDLKNGIDVFNTDDSVASRSNPKDVENLVDKRHGFLYVEMIDRPGDDKDEFVVRSITTEDNWESSAWGKEWRKTIQIPANASAK